MAHNTSLANKNTLIAIVGPTGAGKSRLALKMAAIYNGEVVNADSRQIYRYMDIGTAKPTAEEMKSVPHHLYDIVDPNADFSLAQYLELSRKSILEIQSRHKIPFLVGGSGQYVWAVIEGWEIPRVPPDAEYRRHLEDLVNTKGTDELYQQLINLDPQAAANIDKRNVRRVIRALEVTHQAKVPFSQLKGKNPPDYQTLIIGLTVERKELYLRLDKRVDEMVKQGLATEVDKLIHKGYDLNLASMGSIGYNRIGEMIRGELSLDEAVEKIKIDNHRFVRHQYAWFRLKDERIRWFDAGCDIDYEVTKLISDFINSGPC